jgi:hypothetical protein
MQSLPITTNVVSSNPAHDHIGEFQLYRGGHAVLLVEETGVLGENHRPVASHWQTLSHNVVSSTPGLNEIRIHNIKYAQNRKMGNPNH